MSRKRSQSKPYWKRRVKQQPGYKREYAFLEDGGPAMQDGHYVIKNPDGTLEYDKEHQVYRDVPNRAMVRRIAADIRRSVK